MAKQIRITATDMTKNLGYNSKRERNIFFSAFCFIYSAKKDYN